MIFKYRISLKVLIVILISSVFLGSCTKTGTQKVFESKVDLSKENEPVNNAFVAEYNKVAIQISQRIFEENQEAVVFSPLGFFVDISMVSGADPGNHLIEKLFSNYPNHPLDIIKDLNTLYIRELFIDETGFFQVYSSLWLNGEHQRISITKEYKNFLEENFYGSIYQINFSEKEGKEILSTWIKDKSNNRIEDPTVLNSNADALFLNITNLKIPWENHWQEQGDILFYGKEEREIPAIGSEIAKLPVLLEDKFTCLQLPLKHGMKVLILMPEHWEDLSLLMEENFIEAFQERSSYADVGIQMPKINIKSKTNLLNVLKDLVLDNEEVIKISAGHGFNEDLYIQSVQQDSYFAWDENGVDVSTLTSIEGITSAIMDEEVIIDKPFIFFIINANNAIVFSGKYE